MAQSQWVNEAELEAEVGAKNIIKLADLDNNRNAGSIDTIKQRAMDVADQIVNGHFKLAGYLIPLSPLPGQTIDSDLIRLCAAKIAHWQLYTTKGKRDLDQEGNHIQEKYDWAIAMLTKMTDMGIPAEGPDSDGDGDPDAPIQPGQLRSMRINRKSITPLSDEYDRGLY